MCCRVDWDRQLSAGLRTTRPKFADQTDGVQEGCPRVPVDAALQRSVVWRESERELKGQRECRLLSGKEGSRSSRVESAGWCPDEKKREGQILLPTTTKKSQDENDLFVSVSRFILSFTLRSLSVSPFFFFPPPSSVVANRDHQPLVLIIE